MKTQKRGNPLLVIGVLLILGAAVALGIGFWYLEGYRRDDAVYERLADTVSVGQETGTLELFEEEPASSPEAGETVSTDAATKKPQRIASKDESASQTAASTRPWDSRLAGLNWGSLKASIPNIVGWIRMASGADYPIVQGADDVRYLSVDAYGNQSGNGSIFMYSRNNPLWTDPVTYVYGHRMTTGTMFGTNQKYFDPSYVAQYPYFYIYTPEGRWRYRIFAVSSTTKDSPIYAGGAYGEAAMTAYLERVQAGSQIFVPGVATWDSHIVVLSTCTGPSGGVQRLLVLGALDGFLGADGTELQRADAEAALAEKEGGQNG